MSNSDELNAGASGFWSSVGGLYHGLATAAGYGVLAALATALVHDLSLRANSQEVWGQVRELARLSEMPELLSWPETPQDFDGDGVLDKLTLKRHEVHGMTLGYSSFLLQLHSGRTAKLLFAKRIFIHASLKGWCADFDGNGTPELVIERRPDFIVYGYEKDSL